MKSENRIVYSINVADIQEVAQDELGRRLTKSEIKEVENELGDYIDWHGAIANAILFHLRIKEKH